MTTAEISEKLCSITAEAVAFTHELVLFIENHLAVDEEIKRQFADRQNRLSHELDLVETGLFPSAEREG